MTLRARLSFTFALFAVVPLLAALWPVASTLTQTLEAEHAARLEGAARAIEAELARLGGGAADALQDLASSREAAELGREVAGEAATPPEAQARVAEWAVARGLEILALCDADGRVVASAHLPGRAGDVDPALVALLRDAPPGTSRPLLTARAGAGELERVLGLVAWAEVPGAALRVVGGVALGRAQAARLASLTGGSVVLREVDGGVLAEAASPEEPGPALWLRFARLAGSLTGAARSVPVGPAAAPTARVEVTLASTGLVRAGLTVLLAFALSLVVATGAAAGAGRLLAVRITRPVEALRAAAARVAGGDLSARVAVPASGEMGELVASFDAMTADLERSRARLAAVERVAAWREVARRLAHEIKNPLTPIAMSVETLRDARGRPDFEEILGESTQAIGEEVARLKRIVDEFTRFARLPDPELRPVAAGELALALLARYPSAPPGVTLVREVEPDLPAVQADRDQLLQVLHNLVKNALEAMPGGGALVIGARRERTEVVFEVRDSGAGIAPEDLPHIFEPYFTTKAGGTGLGLAIAERIVSEHGGRIEVTSRPGAGTRVAVRLPVATSPASP